MAQHRELILILVLAFVVLVLVSISSFFKLDVEESDAKKFVHEDLRTKYPYEDTELLNTVEKRDEQGNAYFEIKVRITKEAQSACPERFHTYYYYPKQNFVNPPDEVITRDCKICIGTEKLCVIAFKEEAIIASHTTAGTTAVDVFIKKNADVGATVEETESSWVVIWKSPYVEYGYRVEVARNGTLRNMQEIKTA